MLGCSDMSCVPKKSSTWVPDRRRFGRFKREGTELGQMQYGVRTVRTWYVPSIAQPVITLFFSIRFRVQQRRGCVSSSEPGSVLARIPTLPPTKIRLSVSLF